MHQFPAAAALTLAATAVAAGQTTHEASVEAEATLLGLPPIGAPAPEDPPRPYRTIRDVSVSVGADYVTKYISRGIVFSNEPSVQPWLELRFALTEPDDDDPHLTWRIGTWNSMQGADAGEGRPRGTRERRLRHWYEFDLYTGLQVDFFDHFQTSFMFYYYSSPSGAFDDIHELEWRLNYDDQWVWEQELGLEGFALYPAMRITAETRHPERGGAWYFQPSITPSYTLQDAPVDLTVSVPVILGFGANEMYLDEDGENIYLGMIQSGLRLSTPIDLGDGDLSIRGGLDVTYVTDSNINGFGNDVEFVGRLGVTYNF